MSKRPLRIHFLIPNLLVLVVVVFCFTLPASAALIGSVFRDYGTAEGKVAPAGGVNPLFADHVEIRDDLGQNAFSDVFDFSGLNYVSVDSFALTLTFSDTNDGWWWFPFFRETWNVRPAISHTVATDSLFSMTRSNNLIDEIFTFTSANLDIFDQIVNQKAFYLWFSETSWGNHDFPLYSAKLDLHGTPVPLPGTAWLLGLGLIGLVTAHKRHTNRPTCSK